MGFYTVTVRSHDTDAETEFNVEAVDTTAAEDAAFRLARGGRDHNSIVRVNQLTSIDPRDLHNRKRRRWWL